MSFSLYAWRPIWAAVLTAVFTAAATAQPASAPPDPPTLRQALDAAWALTPAARAAEERRAELQARQRATQGLLAGSPTAAVAHRTDRLAANGGLREWEAELELPLWNPGVRGATQRQVHAEQDGLDQQLSLARLKLAGELRELATQAAVARIEHTIAVRKLAEARTLASDVERRVRAGDLARVDGLQAQGAVQQAAATEALAAVQFSRIQAQWRATTGLEGIPELGDQEPLPASDAVASHPTLLAAQSQARVARARLGTTEADRREPMSLAIGAIRERSAAATPAETTLRIALRVPLGGDVRNAPRLAAARAELLAAEAEAEAISRQLNAEFQATRAELVAAKAALTTATERARLAEQVQTLVAKAFRLGEADLPTRLRADNERFDADLAHARARLDVQRAAVRLNQALGLLP